MPAFQALNRKQFFHGTTFHFEPGDIIDPKDRPAPQPLSKSERIGPWTHRTAAGHLMSDEMVKAPPNLYVTPDKGLAQNYADQHKGTGRMYQVRLSGPHHDDPYPAKGHFYTEHPVQVVRELKSES
jgi:hypothetical protein